ncbi:hypothetical protein LJK88_06140 [Paenibacillus sp. P26]|nr:hypothetical protein LJK88_06140 [Paenibacillus sp. P26]
MRTKSGEPAAAVAAAGETSVKIFNLQLRPGGGRLYFTVTSAGKRESLRTSKLYDAE